MKKEKEDPKKEKRKATNVKATDLGCPVLGRRDTLFSTLPTLPKLAEQSVQFVDQMRALGGWGSTGRKEGSAEPCIKTSRVVRHF